MSESNLSNAAKSARRIAGGHAARTLVDSQGRPIGEPALYTYDENGLLIKAEPGQAPE